MRKNTFIKTMILAIMLVLGSGSAWGQTVLVGWDFNGLSAYGSSPLIPNTTAANLIIVGLTRGAGITTTGTAAGSAWGGNGLDNTSSVNALSGSDYISFTITANTGYKISLNSINAYNVRRSSTGATSGQWQYQVGSGSFVDVGSTITWGSTTSSSGNSQGLIALTGIAELQNVIAGTTITFRCIVWGGSAANGTWYLNNFQGGNDFSINGTVISTFTGTGDWSDISKWSTGSVPGTTNNVVIDGDATINSNVTVEGLTINSGKSLTVNATKQLTVSGTATNNGTITLQSDATGTGTIVGNVTRTATVNQYLSGDGRAWWYLSTPVTGTTSSDVFGANKVGQYNEASTSYSSPFASGTSLVPGTGYVVKLSATTGGTYSFTGTLNSGDYKLDPTRTVIDAGKRGFNLVGNPYPSYLNWDAAYADAATNNIRNAIWYRTYDGSNMTFYTYADADAVPEITTGMIPPMQAFWIKVNADGSNGSITFKNTHREHAGVTSNLLKAPKNNDRQRIRLQVSNGVNSDEMLVVAKSYATNGVDSYDVEKMSNDNDEIPEIYCLLNNQEMVINSVNSFTVGQELALGFRPGKVGDFTITSTQLENISSDIEVLLKDKLTGAETQLSEGTSYSFSSDATVTDDRFNLIFRAPGSVTGTNMINNGTLVVYAQQSEIVATSADLSGSIISVYNTTGLRLFNIVATSNREVLKGNFIPGVYIVKVNDTVKKVSVK